MKLYRFPLALLISMSAAYAQPPNCNTEACAEQYYLKSARIGIKNILSKFKPHIENAVPFLYEQGAVRIKAYADFNAYVDYENGEIILPAQFIIETHLLAQAAARASANEKLESKVMEYTQYLVDRSEKARLRGGIDDGLVLSFPAFLGESPSEAQAAWTPQLTGRFAAFFLDSLAATLAHEIGHHALKHQRGDKITPAQSRAQERAADRFAINLVTKTGYSPAGAAVTTIMRFSLREGHYGAGDLNTRTHPLAECRLYAYNDALMQEQFKSSEVPVGIDIKRLRREWNGLRKHCEADDK
jgi:hypothetical protein